MNTFIPLQELKVGTDTNTEIVEEIQTIEP